MDQSLPEERLPQAGMLRYNAMQGCWHGRDAVASVTVANRVFQQCRERLLAGWGLAIDIASEDQNATALYLLRQVAYWKYRPESGIVVQKEPV